MSRRLQVPTAAGVFEALAEGPGDGAPVMLLHGFPEASDQWEHQLEALGRAGRRAVAFDQRGYSPGVRPVEVEAYAIEHLVNDVIDVADALGWERFDLVGHDWGSAVSWSVAAAHPDRLRTLTAVSVPHGRALSRALREDPDQLRRSAYFALFRTPGEAEEKLLGGEMREFFAGVPEDRAAHYLARMAEPGALTAALNWYRAMGPPPVRASVRVPTLYVWSTEDAFIGKTAAQACGEFVDGPFRFEVLEGVSHWISEQAPEQLSELLLEHLA